MKKLLLSVALVVMFANGTKAQSNADSVVVETIAESALTPAPMGFMTANGRGIFVDGGRITVAEAKALTRSFPEAMKHIRTAQAVYGVAMVAAFSGGYLLGTGLGRSMNHQYDGTSKSGYYLGGVALCGVAAGLTFVTIKEYKKVAAIYNSGSRPTSAALQRRATLSLTPSGSGLGLRLVF